MWSFRGAGEELDIEFIYSKEHYPEYFSLEIFHDGAFTIKEKQRVYENFKVTASLSVVAFVAACDAATLSIISLALATLTVGVFIFGYNLWKLREDSYNDNYFPLQAFLAIISFLVFGMVPPVAYGLSFHETTDKDFTLMVVVVASLLCVSLLAMFKAYTNKCRVFQYFKTIVYYITIAVAVSGVYFIAGTMLKKLMEEFETSSGDGIMSRLPYVTSTPSLASF